jgi:hypothetical protein
LFSLPAWRSVKIWQSARMPISLRWMKDWTALGGDPDGDGIGE